MSTLNHDRTGQWAAFFDGFQKLSHLASVWNLAFPDGKHLPAGGPQCQYMLIVASSVSADFRQPVSAVRLRFAPAVSASRAPMPEAAVNKHANPLADKNQIRLSGQGRDVKAVSQSSSVQVSADEKFRLRVLALNPRHHCGPLRLAQGIRHRSKQVKWVCNGQGAMEARSVDIIIGVPPLITPIEIRQDRQQIVPERYHNLRLCNARHQSLPE